MSHGLYDEDAWHDGPTREMAWEEWLIIGNIFDPHDSLSWLDFHNTILVLFVLIQIPLSSEYLKAAAPDASYLQALSTAFAQGQLYAYEIGMSALGVSGLMLCYTLYRAKLVPRWLAVWGLVGYAIILFGMLSAVMGSGLGDVSSLPGGLWEVFIGVWLIAKGFNSSEFVSQATRTSNVAEPLLPYPDPANS